MAMPSAAPSVDQQRGVTLIESLLALAVIASGVLAVVTLLVRGIAAQRMAATQAVANGLLADAAEALQLVVPPGPALATAELLAWQARVPLELPPGSAGAAAGAVVSQVLADGSSAQSVQVRFASSGRSVDTTLELLSVSTEWLATGP